MSLSISQTITHILQIDIDQLQSKLAMPVLPSHPSLDGPAISIPTIASTADHAQDLDLVVKTCDEQRRRFLTECQILGSITTDSANWLKYQTLGELYNLNIKERALENYSHSTNNLLNYLACLLDKGRSEDSVAVAITGLTAKKIKLTIQLGQSSLNEKCHHRDPVEIIKHVEKIFQYIDCYLEHSPGGRYFRADAARDYVDAGIPDPRDEIWVSFAIYQLEQSFEKLRRRFIHLQIFCLQVRNFILPHRTPITESGEVNDDYYIPTVDLECSDVLVDLYGHYLRSLHCYERSSAPSIEAMTKLTSDNFERWSMVFIWFFKRLETSLKGFNKNRVDFRDVAQRLTILGTLVANSQLFRDWFSIMTRSIAEKDSQRDYEAGVEGAPARDRSRQISPNTADFEEEVLAGHAQEKSSVGKILKSLVPQKIRNVVSELKTKKEELEDLKEKLGRQLVPVQEETGTDSKEKEDYNDNEDDADEEFPMIISITKPTTVKNIVFKRVALVVQTLFITREVLHSRSIHRYMKGKTPEITVLSPPRVKGVEKSELEFENLGRTSSWLLRHEPQSQNREDKINNFISLMKESLNSRPAKMRQLNHISKDIPEHPRMFAPQHPELMLLSYLTKQNIARDYPYPYIGLAKPPCLVCGIVVAGSKFYHAMNMDPSSCCITKVPTDLPSLAQGFIFSSIDRLAGKVARGFYNERNKAGWDGDID
ncbi:hypothetical protein TWF506_005228 [Arthrobotrys conoides]|uniref:Uncharacterized protein n=1 Tax=Arthrobotrys conoides TaxID=74498 RepID=A0AAN8S2P3_9PEZI